LVGTLFLLRILLLSPLTGYWLLVGSLHTLPWPILEVKKLITLLSFRHREGFSYYTNHVSRDSAITAGETKDLKLFLYIQMHEGTGERMEPSEGGVDQVASIKTP
jgi:hypothetical protein